VHTERERKSLYPMVQGFLRMRVHAHNANLAILAGEKTRNSTRRSKLAWLGGASLSFYVFKTIRFDAPPYFLDRLVIPPCVVGASRSCA
jgi:hypothetical protein